MKAVETRPRQIQPVLSISHQINSSAIQKTLRRALLIALFSSLNTLSVAQVSIDWVQYTAGNAIAIDDAENVYTVTYVYNPGGDILLTKRDSDGTFLWQAGHDNTDMTKWENSTWVATDNGGNILVSGDVNSGYSNPVKANSLLMKFDPDGNLLWRVVYEGIFDGSYTKKCLIDDQDNIYVLGTGHGTTGFVTTVKMFSPDGTVQWSYFDDQGIGLPVNFKFSPDGGIVLVGRSLYGSINGYTKIDRNGNHIWSYPGVNSLTVGDAAGDTGGNTYLVHGEYVANGGTVLKKVSPSGALLWEYIHSPFSGFRVEVGQDDNPVVSGFPNQGTAGAAFIKVDRDGNLLWVNLDADGPHALLLHALMLMDASDDIYLAAGTLFEMAVCKVKSDGTSAWTAVMPGSYAYSFIRGSTNNVYVVGGTTAKLIQDSLAGQPPVVSDIPDQNVPPGGRFAPIRVDNHVTDLDHSDAEITWTWSGNNALQVSWDAFRRRIQVRAGRRWTGSETITFTATDPDGLSDSDAATFTVPAARSSVALSERSLHVAAETALTGN